MGCSGLLPLLRTYALGVRPRGFRDVEVERGKTLLGSLNVVLHGKIFVWSVKKGGKFVFWNIFLMVDIAFFVLLLFSTCRKG
jgi:hypothetical protein